MVKKIKLSIIVLTRNSEAYITQCIESLINSIPMDWGYEIFVVDNGSSDRTLEYIKNYTSVNLISLDKNYGTTVSRNIAIKRSIGDYLAIVDSDIFIEQLDWCLLLKNFTSGTALIAPRLYFPNKTLQHSVKKFPLLQWRLQRIFNIIFKTNLTNYEHYEDIGAVTYPDTAISAFWVVKKELIKKVGLLDERIYYSPEDVDFCARIWKSGYMIKYVQTGLIVHHTQQLAHKNPISLISATFFFNLLYYFWKHGYCFNAFKLDKIKGMVLNKYSDNN